jgi:hypothetical protein
VGADFFGCSWNLVGKGQGTYPIDLAQPAWCGPTACFDLQATSANFLTPWTTELSTVELRITGLTLGVDPSRALPSDGRIGTMGCE